MLRNLFYFFFRHWLQTEDNKSRWNSNKVTDMVSLRGSYAFRNHSKFNILFIMFIYSLVGDNEVIYGISRTTLISVKYFNLRGVGFCPKDYSRIIWWFVSRVCQKADRWWTNVKANWFIHRIYETVTYFYKMVVKAVINWSNLLLIVSISKKHFHRYSNMNLLLC